MITQSEARELSNRIGVPRTTCSNWLRGKSSPTDTIRGWMIDHHLDLMRIQQKPGETFTLREIADRAGVSHEAIRLIEYRALKKVRKALNATIKEINGTR